MPSPFPHALPDIAEATDHPEPRPRVAWWSFSKTVLATAALVLVDRGTLTLDDPLPGAPYTLRQLLQHRAGLRDYGPDPAYQHAVAEGEPAWPVEEMLRRVDASTLLFAPGARFSYSNIGYLFVRQLIERAVDADLDAALRQLVFAPLGIDQACVANEAQEFETIAWPGPATYDPRWVYHGCVVGSLPVAAACLHRILYGRLLAPLTQAAMRVPGRYDPEGNAEDAPEELGYGLGLMIEPGPPGDVLAGHAGGGPGNTVVVFSAIGSQRTFAAGAGSDAPGTFPALLDLLRARVRPAHG